MGTYKAVGLKKLEITMQNGYVFNITESLAQKVLNTLTVDKNNNFTGNLNISDDNGDLKTIICTQKISHINCIYFLVL